MSTIDGINKVEGRPFRQSDWGTIQNVALARILAGIHRRGDANS